LRPALTRLEMRADLLEEVAGVRKRRIWDGPIPVAPATSSSRSALTRLEMRADLLEEVAGVRKRRIWDGPIPVAPATAPAGRKPRRRRDWKSPLPRRGDPGPR
jgi:hypothetical protein